MAWRKVWVLDTETKGTGAQMVPLDAKTAPPVRRPLFVPPKPPPRPEPGPAPRAPRRFRVVDVLTREALADGADAPATLALLGEVRGMADVNVYVWEPARGDWRLLSLAEQQVMWDRRGGSTGR